jgi:hypothetical protein
MLFFLFKKQKNKQMNKQKQKDTLQKLKARACSTGVRAKRTEYLCVPLYKKDMKVDR